ncbi:hypothetical protein [Halobacterium sp. KA-6]|nr:hypothetical protein [Halobacterium sp. KA-6]MCD2201976.1 hypothetical protein [Halobacterium sp. KA-6]
MGRDGRVPRINPRSASITGLSARSTYTSVVGPSRAGSSLRVATLTGSVR